MSAISKKFNELRGKGEKALVGFVTAGDPDFPRSHSVIAAMCRAGVDILELGVPFSDPTADGPVIQRSSKRSLDGGANLAKVLDLSREIRKEFSLPIVLFSYYNPILAYGAKRFYEDARAAGADGLLVVDLPVEESEELTSVWPGQDLDLIRLVAPTTPPERMKMIAEKASGFLYLVSMTGVTGSAGLDREVVEKTAAELRAVTALPICVGFGVSTPAHIAELRGLCDGVVVGSAFERLIESNLDDARLADKVFAYTETLKAATRS
ncbi:MAG: tryptophan synthase subunit alpha [Thermodesulfobacteriota bacterium]